MLDGLASLPAFPTFQRLLRSDNQKLIAKFQDRPIVDKEIQYFRDKAPKLASIDELFKDPRLLRFITSADHRLLRRLVTDLLPVGIRHCSPDRRRTG